MAVLSGALEDMGDAIEAFDRYGPDYARRYAEYLLGPKRRNPPQPRGLRPELAKAIRESVRDRALAIRTSGGIEAQPRRGAARRRAAA